MRACCAGKRATRTVRGLCSYYIYLQYKYTCTCITTIALSFLYISRIIFTLATFFALILHPIDREANYHCAPIVSSGPLLVLDTALGAGAQGIPVDMASEQLHWTQHYRTHPRCPEKVDDLAPWVRDRLNSQAAMLPPPLP